MIWIRCAEHALPAGVPGLFRAELDPVVADALLVGAERDYDLEPFRQSNLTVWSLTVE